MLTVKHTLHRRKGEALTPGPTKGGKARSVVLGADALAALRQHRRVQMVERPAAEPLWQPLDFVFTTAVGTPVDATNLASREFRRLTVAAALPRIRLHDLRHTSATMLLAAGVHPRTVQERLGHSDIRVTMNTYSHVLPTLQRQAAETMDATLRRES